MFEILIGHIASGKSTWTKERAKQGAVVVNDDSLIESLHGGVYTAYDKGLKPMYKCLSIMTACMGVLNHRDIVIDSTNLTKARRRRWIDIAKMLDMPVVGIMFPIEKPEIHAGRRHSSDPRGYDFDYWLNVARKHNSIYEAPVNGEGFDNLVPLDIAQQMLSENMWASQEKQ